ncbi:MAG: pilus assembly protein PilM [Candidatus Omnitrophica bacterium]|nr:pilus assembly protein PilM [Candidatus Omnitrophota bacterium]
MASSLGIYFGQKNISIAESKGKALIKESQVSRALISSEDLEDKATSDVKLVASLKEALRTANIECKDAVLCLSGKDLIVRTFEMPVLPKDELQNAINFEAKKYIPFKFEDMISDSRSFLNNKTRTNSVVFIGIKKDSLVKYLSLFQQLNIKVSSIEYSPFSLTRFLKAMGIDDKGAIAVLDLCTSGEDEINFTVLENGFPLFSRDIDLISGPQGPESPEEVPGSMIEKLKTEVRVSLDYFHRKAPDKKIRKIFLFSEQEARSDIEAFLNELGLLPQYIETSKIFKSTRPYSLSLIKAYSSSLIGSVKIPLVFELLKEKAKPKLQPMKDAAALNLDVNSLFADFVLDFRMIVVGALICLGTFGFALFRVLPVRNELNRIKTQRIEVSSIAATSSPEELIAKEDSYREQLNTVDKFIKKQLYVTKPLNVIPAVIPDGIWLDDFTFSKTDQGRPELALRGVAYLSDSNKEFTVVNEFVSNLKNNPEFSGYFKEIAVSSIDSGSLGKFTVTNFLILCKGLDKGK